MKAFKQDVDHTKEILRQSIVNHAKFGFTVALDVNMEMPDWKTKQVDELYDSDLMFDFQNLRKEDNAKKILTDEKEDVDD